MSEYQKCLNNIKLYTRVCVCAYMYINCILDFVSGEIKQNNTTLYMYYLGFNVS